MASQDKENKEGVPVEPPQQIASESPETEVKKNKFPGFNLYVKYLDDSFTDTTLREAFDEFGTITSAKVMCDAAGHSRGFGFVCFAAKDEATKALAKMNGRIVGTKPLYVSMAQRKEERKQYLNDKYKNYGMNPALPVSPPAPAQPQVAPQAVETQIQYVPNNSVVPGTMQYRYLPGETQWQATGNPYTIPGISGVSPQVAFMSYQPLVLVPSLNMMAPPPPQMPILHQPIYIQSTKNNTLIYSTSVQATSPQTQPASPGVYSQHMNSDSGALIAPAAYQDDISPQLSPNFKSSVNTASFHDHTAPSNSPEEVSPNKHNGNMLFKSVPPQLRMNPNFQFPSSSNNNFTT